MTATAGILRLRYLGSLFCYSRHGVDYEYYRLIQFDDFYCSYCETILSIDESIGDILKYLKKPGKIEIP